MKDYKLGFNRHAQDVPRPISDVESIPSFTTHTPLTGAFQVLIERKAGKDLEGKYKTQYTVSSACPIASKCTSVIRLRDEAIQAQRNIVADAYELSVEYLDAQDELQRLENTPLTINGCPNGCTAPCIPAPSEPSAKPRDVTPANIALQLAIDRDPADNLDSHNILRPRSELYPKGCNGYCPKCGKREKPIGNLALRAQQFCTCHQPKPATQPTVSTPTKPKTVSYGVTPPMFIYEQGDAFLWLRDVRLKYDVKHSGNGRAARW